MSLQNAKVGDDVIVESQYNGKYISKIEAITPKGNFKIKDHGVFNPNGNKRTTGYYNDRAVLATPEDLSILRAHWKTNRLRKEIGERIEKVPLDRLVKIIAIIEGE
jgi:hypothetical protein